MHAEGADRAPGGQSREEEANEYYHSPEANRGGEEEPLEEGEDAGSLPFTDSEAKRSALRRETYIRNMNSKFSHQLNQEIKRISLKDLKMRDVKSSRNEDKLFDYIKISDMRNDNSQEVVQLQQQYDGIESLGSVGAGAGQAYFYKLDDDAQRDHQKSSQQHDSPRFESMPGEDDEHLSQDEELDKLDAGEEPQAFGRHLEDQKDFVSASEQQSPQKDSGADAEDDEGQHEDEQDMHEIDGDSQQYCEELAEEEAPDQPEDAPEADQGQDGVDGSQSEIEEEP